MVCCVGSTMGVFCRKASGKVREGVGETKVGGSDLRPILRSVKDAEALYLNTVEGFCADQVRTREIRHSRIYGNHFVLYSLTPVFCSTHV